MRQNLAVLLTFFAFLATFGAAALIAMEVATWLSSKLAR